jgi:beta-fructofuranosidase
MSAHTCTGLGPEHTSIPDSMEEEFTVSMSDHHPHHRPRFHLSLPHGYLNDPNGPIEVDGTTHLFFQSRPTTDTAAPVEWGHASSPDLVHWRLHRPAIVPVPGGADSDGCWSGNTVRDGEKLRAYYSGKRNDRPFQSILTAVSESDGAAFDAPVQVVEDPQPEEGITMFRDPFVWKDGAHWRMAVGTAGPGGTAAIRHYRSSDGEHWDYSGDLARLARSRVGGEDTGEGWECPQILPVDGREVALVAAWTHTGGPMNVLAFPLDGPVAPQRVDHGDNFYAPSVMRGGPGGAVLFGWITEGRDRAAWQEAGWAGAISLPRTAWLDGERLATAPHPNVTALRASAPRVADGAVIIGQAEISAPAVSGSIRLRYGAHEHLDIALDPEAGTVELDRTSASQDPRAQRGRSMVTDAFDAGSGLPGIRVFIDGSIIEVFTSAGRSLTSRAYPAAPPPWAVEAPAGAQLWDLAPAVRPAGADAAGVDVGRSIEPVGS